MKALIILCACILFVGSVKAQTRIDSLPGIHYSADDSFFIRYDGDTRRDGYKISRTNQSSPGTDASPGQVTTIYYGKDSIKLVYNARLPYAQLYFVNFRSEKGATTLRFHYNDLTNYFPQSYMKANDHKAPVSIPEVYELANIIWALSPTGQRAKDLVQSGKYYEEVRSFFKPFIQHPLFNQLDFPDSVAAERYYDFRENSFPFNFKDPRPGAKDCSLLFNGPFYYAYGNELADSSLFGKLKPLVEDFAARSGFRKFYKAHRTFYATQQQRETELLPMMQMWTWLEGEFPGRNFNTYRVVFSPLISGSHSTQQYAQYRPTDKTLYREAVMFICGPDRYDSVATLTEKQKQALLSGIVFTEIDHNYVNPVSNKYASRIDSIFSNRTTWARTGNSSDFYGSPVSVFNEYMTHALFCLYILENYDQATAALVIANRETLMVDRRNFIRFREFDQELMRLRKTDPNKKIPDLYPAMLDWCSNP